MTTNLKYSNRDPQQLLCQFFSRNIPIKSGHHLPKEFGDYLRIEVDKKNRREVNLLLIKAGKIRRLNRANIPSKIRIDKRGFMIPFNSLLSCVCTYQSWVKVRAFYFYSNKTATI